MKTKKRRIRQAVGYLDRYRRGRVKYIDFTYLDESVVWVEYKTKCVAYYYY